VSTLNLVAACTGISLVPESLQRMRMDGVVFRRLSGAVQPKAPLYLAAWRDVGGGPQISGIGQAARARRMDRAMTAFGTE
jgi:hypothetical protein